MILNEEPIIREYYDIYLEANSCLFYSPINKVKPFDIGSSGGKNGDKKNMAYICNLPPPQQTSTAPEYQLPVPWSPVDHASIVQDPPGSHLA